MCAVFRANLMPASLPLPCCDYVPSVQLYLPSVEEQGDVAEAYRVLDLIVSHNWLDGPFVDFWCAKLVGACLRSTQHTASSQNWMDGSKHRGGRGGWVQGEEAVARALEMNKKLWELRGGLASERVLWRLLAACEVSMQCQWS